MAAGQDLNIAGAVDDRVSTVALEKDSESFKAYLKTGDMQYLRLPALHPLWYRHDPATFGSGNYSWPRFGEEVARKENVPVLIYNAAFGGTSLEHWAKSSQGVPFEHSFVRSAIRDALR